MSGLLKGAIKQRLEGGKPSPVKSALAATVAGAAVAVTTYRIMRH